MNEYVREALTQLDAMELDLKHIREALLRDDLHEFEADKRLTAFCVAQMAAYFSEHISTTHQEDCIFGRET